MTAKGGLKAPRKFFFPNRLTPFLTPTPESLWARTVLGTRMDADPAVTDGGGKSGGVQDRTPSQDHHEGLAIQAQPVHRLHQGQDMAEVRP